MASIETHSAASNGYDGIIYTGSPDGETINGSDKSDSLYGEGGNDTITPYLASVGWRDQVNGGEGVDTLVVDFSSRLGSVTFSEVSVTSPGGTSIWYWISSATVDGESGNASIDYRDFERFNVIGSSTANNSLRGGALDDYLVGGAGSDTIYGYGEVQFDSTSANSGDDTIDIGKGGATAVTTGTDTVNMGSGGNDHLIADYSASTEVVSFAWYTYSGAGVDYSSNGTVTIGGLSRLSFAGVERFTVSTGSANDAIATGNGADMVSSGGGNDTINSGKGPDRIDGGAGLDSWATDLSDVAAAVILNLNLVAAPTAVAGGGVVASIEAFGNLQTGAGNDVVTTFKSGALADTVNTGAGNDTVTVFAAATAAATGSDAVNMGAGGNDHLIADYSAATQVVSFAWYTYLGAGVDYSSSGTVTIGGLSRLSFSGVERFTVKTGSANDVITTGNGADVISGGGGNDTINSGKGPDRVDGGAGADSWASDQSGVAAAIILNLNVAGATTLGGGAVVSGIEAFGNLQTGAGNDVVTTFKSGALADTVNTGAGNDTVTVFAAATAAATGSDTVNMGSGGNDHLIADYSAATQLVSFAWYTYLGAGVDYSSSGTVTIGGLSRLSFSGVERFTVKTGSANDVITTGNGADVISGGGGNDTINSGKGADRVDGGAGADSWASDQSGVAAAIILNLNVAGATTLAGGAVVSGIERLSNLRTGLGNDVITTLASGGRADTIDTGAGNDKVTVFSAATAAATATDTINMGSGGTDHLIADYSASTEVVSFSWYTYYGAGVDYSSNGTVTIGGLSKLSFSGVERFTVKTGSAADTVNTGDAADVISGGGGNDRLFAHGGNDLVYGGAGADLLVGDDGNDKIFGGLGNDILYGDAGNDGFYFDAAGSSTNRDKIEDFNSAGDSVLLKKGVFNIATVSTPTASAPSTIKADTFKRIDGYDAANPKARAVDPDSSDRIIYDQAGGKIYYDADGSGTVKAILFATVDPGTVMSASDFLIFI